MILMQKGQCTQHEILLRAGERHTDRMAWVHFDLWSSPVHGVDGCVSGLVWSGFSLLHQILPFRVSLCLLSDLHVS